MVGFGENILSGRVSEWQPYYINYTRLKGWIKEMERDKSESARRAWEEELRANMRRVDCFYTAQESRLHRRVMNLPGQTSDSDDATRKKEGDAIKEEMSKLAAFAEMNCEGLRKITKKFDKKVDVHVEEDPDEDKQTLAVQRQMFENLKTFPFSQAKERLMELDSSIDNWIYKQDWHEPVLDAGHFKRLDDLEVPLLKSDRMKQKLRLKMPKYTKRVLRFFIDNVVIWLLTATFCAGAKYGDIPRFTTSSYLVCWVTTVVLVLLIRQYPPDGVLMSATLLLTICNVLTPEDAWAAFANDVVLSVAGLGCIAQAVGGTGVIDLVFTAVLGKPKTVHMAMLRLFIPSILLNVCISNTCVMSCLLPVLDKWSVEIGIHRALFLMPLSYVLLISGVFAVFSTSTNLIAQGLLVSHNQPKLPTFALSGPVVICTLAAVVYLMIATPWILKRFQDEQKDNQADDKNGSRKGRRLTTLTYDIRAQIVGKSLPGMTITSSGLLERLQFGIESVVSCERYGEFYGDITDDFQLALDDVFLLKTSAEGIIKVRDMAGVLLLSLDSSEAYAGACGWQSRELVEVVIDQDCRMVNHRIVNSKEYFPRSTDCSIVAFRSFTEQSGKIEESKSASPHSNGDKVPQVMDIAASPSEKIVRAASGLALAAWNAEAERAADLPEKRLVKGDHLIFDAPTDFYERYKESADFVVVRRLTKVPREKSEFNPAKAVVAGIVLVIMVALVASNTLPLLEAVFAALAALIITQCTSLDAVVKAVKLPTVLTIVGAFGLGKAIGQEHVADALADLLLFLLAPFGRTGLLAAVFAATVALGVVFHGTAVVVLMYPICQEAAEKTNMPIHQVVAVLCIAVSCQMLSPISYQTNLMAYSAGGYQFTDFTKLGSGLVCVLGCVSIPLCQYWFAENHLESIPSLVLL